MRPPNPRDADVVVINTCSVREGAEHKLYTRLGEVRQASRETGRTPIVAVAGCVAQQEAGAMLKRSNLIDVIIGTQSLKQLPVLVSKAFTDQDDAAPRIDVNTYEDVSFPLGVARRHDPVKAYITIIEGCNEFCSFCVVPYTRGHGADAAEARHPRRKFDRRRGRGIARFNCSAKSSTTTRRPTTPSCDFAALLEAVHEVPGVERIRFASPHPRHVPVRLMEAVRDLPKVCKHFHLPVQSGSTRVLAAMRRRYTRDSYLELVDTLRGMVPGIVLTTDMIVGFPGETDGDFDETMSLTRAVRYETMYSFKYSPRPNTLAQKRYPEDVPRRSKNAAYRGAPGAAAGDSTRDARSGSGLDGRGAGRLGEPSTRLGALGTDVGQHRRELSGPAGVARAHGRRACHQSGRVQPCRRSTCSLTLPVSRPSVTDRAPCKSK